MMQLSKRSNRERPGRKETVQVIAALIRGAFLHLVELGGDHEDLQMRSGDEVISIDRRPQFEAARNSFEMGDDPFRQLMVMVAAAGAAGEIGQALQRVQVSFDCSDTIFELDQERPMESARVFRGRLAKGA